MGEVSTVRKKNQLVKTICFGFVLLASSTFFIALAAYKDSTDLFGNRFDSVIAVPRVNYSHVQTTLWVFFQIG